MFDAPVPIHATLRPLEDIIKNGVNVIRVSAEDSTTVLPGELCVDYDAAVELYNNAEIKSSIKKRMRGKPAMCDGVSYLDMVAWCLSVRSYGFSSRYIKGTSDDEIESLWQYIDTLSISSTESCRKLISKYKDRRTATGFQRSVRTDFAEKGKIPLVSYTEMPPTLGAYSDSDISGYGSVGELVAYQCSEFVFSSKDPVSVASAMVRSVNHRNKAAESPTMHMRQVAPNNRVPQEFTHGMHFGWGP